MDVTKFERPEAVQDGATDVARHVAKTKLHGICRVYPHLLRLS